MTPAEITSRAKAIKQHLQRRSGKQWSVRSDTHSTAYGHIIIDVPRKAYATPDYASLADELGRLMGFNGKGGQMGFHASNDDYLQRAMGTLVDPETCGLCGTVEYRHQAPYCPRCQVTMDAIKSGRYQPY